jgi:hypothetical protein
MKRFAAVLLCLALSYSAPARADEDLFQSALNVAASVTSNKLGGGRWYSVSCDGPVYYRTCIDSAGCTAVTTDPQLKNFDVPVPIYVRNGRYYIALLKVAAATSCNIYYYVDKG